MSTTFGGEMLSLAVCQAVITEYRQSTDYIQRIAALGERLRDGINERAERLGSPLRVLGYDAIPLLQLLQGPRGARPADAAVPGGGMARRGVLLRRDVNFICAAHTQEQIDHTIEMAEEVLRSLAKSGGAA